MEVLKCAFVLLTLVLWSEGSKYSEDKNITPDPNPKLAVPDAKEKLTSDEPFRMGKMNLLWQKAKRYGLSNAHLAELKVELATQDKLEMELKARTIEPSEEDGEFEASVRSRLLDTLGKYGLRDAHPDMKLEENEVHGKDKLDNNLPNKLDQPLKRMWRKAEMSGFSDEELQLFKQEMLHHQQKVEELELLKKEMDQYVEPDNSIDNLKKDKESFKTERKEKKEKMMKKLIDVKASMDQLDDLLSPSATDNSNHVMGFRDPRVIEMWKTVLNANMSEEAVASFKTELKHFEHKLRKLEHFQKEVALSEENLGRQGKLNLLENVPEKHAKLDMKARKYGQKVKKIETEIRDRLGRMHSEL